MITFPILQLPDVIPEGELEAWRGSIKQPKGDIPPKVMEFIEGMAANLPAFQQYQQDQDYFTGRDLLLCGHKVWGNKWIEAKGIYPVKVPKMMAVDPRTSMMSIYLRRGKQGLIDYVKVQLRGRSLERILYNLHVNIFNEQDPKASKEFTSMMDQINKEKPQPTLFE